MASGKPAGDNRACRKSRSGRAHIPQSNPYRIALLPRDVVNDAFELAPVDLKIHCLQREGAKPRNVRVGPDERGGIRRRHRQVDDDVARAHAQLQRAETWIVRDGGHGESKNSCSREEGEDVA